MKKIAIITDTDSSLPAEIAGSYDIRQVPILVQFEEETFTSGVDIDDGLLFEKVDLLNKLPTTAAPGPKAFETAFQSAFSAGADAIVCLCVSSKVSATYQSARVACDAFAGREIEVVDTLNLCMGQGFMVLAAAEAARSGASVEQTVAAALDAGKQMHTFAVLSTLKYLALSGRVGKFVAGMADTLNIKPILTIQDGKLDLLEKVRTRKKAVERTLELLHRAVDRKSIQRAAVVHVNDPVGAKALLNQLNSEFAMPESTLTVPFGPGLSVHAGSGVVGIVLQTRP
jgi:DegV family protein with EDD domain